MERIYLDYAATTPVDKRVLEAMTPYFTDKYGNPGSLHYFGQEAIAAVDRSRETIARAIGAKFEEVLFTGSATEANNLALRGAVKKFKIQNSKFKIPRIIVSAIEHESVLETARDLEKEGIEVSHLPHDREGFVNIEKLKATLDRRTVLVSVMYANNEIGTIQPISKISEIVRNFRNEIFKHLNIETSREATYPLLHVDAVQAFQYLDCNVNRLGVDLMTLSAHKIYGPKGIGALYINSKFKIQNSKLQLVSPIVTGGGQEFGFRSGTENVPLIVGFAKAAELVSNSSFDSAQDKRELESRRVQKLRDYFWNELKKIYPQAERNGGEPSLPNILNVYFPNHKAEDLLIKFDLAGTAVSSGSACRARSPEPSHVLQALGLPMERIKSSIRFSLGRFTTDKEVKEVLKRTEKIFKNNDV